MPLTKSKTRVLALVLSPVFGVAIAFFGTLFHRAGVNTFFPYGLLLAFLAVFLTAFLLRYFANRIAVLIFGLVLAFVVYKLGSFWETGTLLIIKVNSENFIASNCGEIWLYWSWIPALLTLILPKFVFADKIVENTLEIE